MLFLCILAVFLCYTINGSMETQASRQGHSIVWPIIQVYRKMLMYQVTVLTWNIWEFSRPANIWLLIRTRNIYPEIDMWAKIYKHLRTLALKSFFWLFWRASHAKCLSGRWILEYFIAPATNCIPVRTKLFEEIDKANFLSITQNFWILSHLTSVNSQKVFCDLLYDFFEKFP